MRASLLLLLLLYLASTIAIEEKELTPLEQFDTSMDDMDIQPCDESTEEDVDEVVDNRIPTLPDSSSSEEESSSWSEEAPIPKSPSKRALPSSAIAFNSSFSMNGTVFTLEPESLLIAFLERGEQLILPLPRRQQLQRLKEEFEARLKECTKRHEDIGNGAPFYCEARLNEEYLDKNERDSDSLPCIQLVARLPSGSLPERSFPDGRRVSSISWSCGVDEFCCGLGCCDENKEKEEEWKRTLTAAFVAISYPLAYAILFSSGVLLLLFIMRQRMAVEVLKVRMARVVVQEAELSNGSPSSPKAPLLVVS